MLQMTNFYREHQLDREVESGLDLSKWVSIIHTAFEKGYHLPGYRDGVILVPLQLEGTGVSIKHRTITLKPDDVLDAAYVARVEGETPRKRVLMNKCLEDLEDAKYVFVVLYRQDVLAEDGTIIGAEWGVVTHLTSQTAEPEPMHPDTLIANHYTLDGGTSTKMNPSEFESKLGVSIEFWRDKVLASNSDI